MSLVLFLLLIFGNVLNAQTRQKKAAIRLSVAKYVCTVTKEYAGSKNIQNTITDVSQLPDVDDSPCKRVLWTPCETVGCSKFLVQNCKDTGDEGNAGKPSSARIVGGSDAEPNEFPHHVSFLLFDVPFCGGTILDPLHIVTAAHCFLAEEQKTAEIRAGDHSLENIDGTEQLLKAESIIIHENFNSNQFFYDIAIVKLAKPMCFNDAVRPAVLPPENVKATGEATVSGWGELGEGDSTVVDILQKVTLPIASHYKCKEVYAKEGIQIPDTVLCTGFDEGGKSTCKGDSGGPYARKLYNGSFELLGIISFQKGCARPNTPAVYTDVSKYVTWIRSKMYGY